MVGPFVAMSITIVHTGDTPDDVFDPVGNWSLSDDAMNLWVMDTEGNKYEFDLNEVDTVVMERSKL